MEHEPAAETDIAEFLREIVTIESCDPPGREIDVARVVHDRLRAFGIEAEFDEFQDGRANVLGRIPGTGRKPSLVMSAHMDTVPVGRQPWSFGAFSGTVQGDRMLGRGTSDMKGALAAMVFAGAALAKADRPLAGDVLLAFSAGESSNCLGAKRFVERGLRDRMGALLVGEPSSMDVVVVEKGVLWLTMRATGKLGHVSGDPGVNAIDLMVDFLASLRSVTVRHEPHPLLDGPTLRIGRIGGGSAVNVTPDDCFAEVDIRLLPGSSPEEAVEQLRRMAPEGITIDVLDFKPAVESDPNSPFVRLCRNACGIECGREPAVKGVSYYSDAVVLRDGLDVPFAIVGPGDLGMSGQPDETVSLTAVRSAARVYERIAQEWLA